MLALGEDARVRIFHVTTPDQWRAAQEAGSFTGSTRGVSLEQEGYIHCASAEQVDGIVGRYYADLLGGLLVLEVDTDRLTSPWRTEQLAGADAPYPHVYGPIDLAAVVAVSTR